MQTEVTGHGTGNTHGSKPGHYRNYGCISFWRSNIGHESPTENFCNCAYLTGAGMALWLQSTVALAHEFHRVCALDTQDYD